MAVLELEFLRVDMDEFSSFVDQLPELKLYSPDISVMKNDDLLEMASALANRLFAKKIELVKKALFDPRIGIAAIDIAESEKLTPDENAYWGVVVALAMGASVFNLSKDRVNKTPFTVFASSYRRSKELEDLGLEGIASKSKLGFHTDGAISGSSVFMPKNILLYNMLIEYRKPGNLYWVPFALWDKKNAYMEQLGVGRPYRIKVTPSIYEFKNGEIGDVSPPEVEVPIFPEDQENGYPLYLNGKVISCDEDSCFDPTIIDELRESISQNSVRYAIPQKARRVVFARNLSGAHARDVLEEPVEDVPYTRVFVRSVDEDGVELTHPAI